MLLRVACMALLVTFRPSPTEQLLRHAQVFRYQGVDLVALHQISRSTEARRLTLMADCWARLEFIQTRSRQVALRERHIAPASAESDGSTTASCCCATDGVGRLDLSAPRWRPRRSLPRVPVACNGYFAVRRYNRTSGGIGGNARVTASDYRAQRSRD